MFATAGPDMLSIGHNKGPGSSKPSRGSSVFDVCSFTVYLI